MAYCWTFKTILEKLVVSFRRFRNLSTGKSLASLIGIFSSKPSSGCKIQTRYPFKTSVFRVLTFFSCLSFVTTLKICSVKCLRPYHVETTSSRPITEVKQRRAASVLGWVTAWEYAVLQTFYNCLLSKNINFNLQNFLIVDLSLESQTLGSLVQNHWL